MVEEYNIKDNRSGRYVQSAVGKQKFTAFIPNPLPPEPSLLFDDELNQLLSEANIKLGRLDGVADVIPNPDMFVAMYIRQEAVLSSQIEGTQSTLEDVLEYEIGSKRRKPKDVEEVINYVHAINHGLNRLNELPVCLRLIREIHEKLLTGVRGSEKSPGEFRKWQNFIGPEGATISSATFVPPPVEEMHQSLDAFEKFINTDSNMPSLIFCGLAHAQFETIHPFLDGNGRIGRLIITLLLCERGILQRPLLYLSHYLKKHKLEYYDKLMGIRDLGRWEDWLKFFLKGVIEVSNSATETAKKILVLHRDLKNLLLKNDINSSLAHLLLDSLFLKGFITVNEAKDTLGCSYATANKLVDLYVHLGLLEQVTPGRKFRIFRFNPYLDLLQE